MKLGFSKLEITSGIGNTRNQPIRHALPIRSANPVWTLLLSGPALSAMRLPTRREDQYAVTNSSWVSLTF
jgi:hypothetical protein